MKQENFLENLAALDEAVDEIAIKFGIASSDITEILYEPAWTKRLEKIRELMLEGAKLL